MQRGQLIGACALVVTATVASSAVDTAPGRSSQADPASIEARVDRLFARWQTSGLARLQRRREPRRATALERGYGRASLELGVPITPESVFHVASVTKQFTAMSILLLARDGRLSIDDDVRRHLPEWAGPPGVTIRHLLTHTGGLRDAFLLIEMAAPETSRPMHDQLVGLLARQRGLSEESGRRYVYNNGGYVLLAEIVKRRQRPVAPRLRRRSHLPAARHAAIAPPRRRGRGRAEAGDRLHAREATARCASRGRPAVVGNGGLFTTVGDLLRWERNFAEPRVGDAALIASMETPPALPGGETTVYGLGLQMERIGGRRTVGHGGGDQGVSAYGALPDDDLAVAVLCNLDEIDSIELARGVADLYLGEAPGAALPGEPGGGADADLRISPSTKACIATRPTRRCCGSSCATAPCAAAWARRRWRLAHRAARREPVPDSDDLDHAGVRRRCRRRANAAHRRRAAHAGRPRAWRPIRRRPRTWLA